MIVVKRLMKWWRLRKMHVVGGSSSTKMSWSLVLWLWLFRISIIEKGRSWGGILCSNLSFSFSLGKVSNRKLGLLLKEGSEIWEILATSTVLFSVSTKLLRFHLPVKRHRLALMTSQKKPSWPYSMSYASKNQPSPQIKSKIWSQTTTLCSLATINMILEKSWAPS